MPPSKAPYHHGDLRNALADAGLGLIEQVGVEAFSLREVAREVGVSANAAYRHFEDKGALLTAIAVRGFERLSAEMQEAMRAARPKGAVKSRAVARFNAAARAYVHLAQEHPELFGLMFGAAGRACLAAEGALDGPSPGALLGRVLDELVEEKAISTKHRAGAEVRVWSTVHGFASLAQSGPLATMPAVANALVDPQPHVRRAAAIAAGKFGVPALVIAAAQAVRDEPALHGFVHEGVERTKAQVDPGSERGTATRRFTPWPAVP